MRKSIFSKKKTLLPLILALSLPLTASARVVDEPGNYTNTGELNGSSFEGYAVTGSHPAGAGAVIAVGGTFNGGITNSSFSNNSAGDYGGAVYVGGTFTGNITNYSFKGDTPMQEDFHIDDDMRYYHLSDNNPETKIALAVVKNKLVPNSGWTHKLYPRFRIGNMAFIEVYNSPKVFISDLNIQSYYVVVVLDDEPQLVRTPDKELFTKFMNAVRTNPDLMKPSQRLRAALILSIGGVGEYIDKDGIKPSWVDEDGILTIKFQTYIRSNNGMVPPKKVARTLTVNESQDFILETRDF